ncbi:MAG TPA: ATP-dependent helicase, partial [Bacteroidia bacterium]|nr:ATP-dependent helicase [Bacteroidia bacterium]
TYVHRIGRTGRAGENGIAISFCTADEKDYLAGIKKLTGKSMEVITSHPFENPNMKSEGKPSSGGGQRSFQTKRNTFRQRKQY